MFTTTGLSLVAPRARARVVLALLVLVSLLALPRAARAATYQVHSCSNGSTSGWSGGAAGAGATFGNSCPSGFGGNIGTQAMSYAQWTFTAPLDTEIAGFSVLRDFALPADTPYGTGQYFVNTSGSGTGYSNGYDNFGGVYYSGQHWESASGLTGQRSLTLAITCGSGGATCTGGSGLAIHDGAIDLRDTIDPVLLAVSGSLVAGGPLQGTRSISYGASDRGGGVFRAILTVDGAARANKVIDANGGACASAGSFSLVVPCKLSVSDTISVDTTALTEGAHTVQLFVRDATDANQATYGPFAIDVDNVPPPINTSLPLVSGIARHQQTLVADDGTWTGVGITFARQWQRYGAGVWQDIAGATGSSYAVQPADYGKPLRFRSRASNGEGATDAYSQPTDPIASPTDPDGDLDGDGVPNRSDPDIDGDGVPNDGDANPRDPGVGAPPPTNGTNGGGHDANTGGSGGGAGAGAPSTQTQNGLGATAAAALAATFEGTRQRTITVRWGAKRRIIGTLAQPNGAAIVGARLDVSSTPALMGAVPVALGQVATDSHGRFAYDLPAGVSRTIRFGYKAIVEAASYSQTTEVVVRVIPKVTLRADHRSLRNKQTVTFHGTIAGAPAGVRKIVELQALDGRRWRTFASTRLAAKGGRFRYRYRFERTTRTTTYQFRAIVRAETGWPFMTGHTNIDKVKVRP